MLLRSKYNFHYLYFNALMSTTYNCSIVFLIIQELNKIT